MHHRHFDAVTRSLAGFASRRTVVHGLAGAGLGLAWARIPDLAGAKKKRKKHKRKKRKPAATPNEFGCLEVGDPCQNAEQCCSGICDGKKGKRTCRAHGNGTCRQDGLGICTGETGTPFACNNSWNCVCFHTTAGSNFCADLDSFSREFCADCRKDVDCQALGFPSGSACIPYSDGACAGNCESGMACLAPCGSPPAES